MMTKHLAKDMSTIDFSTTVSHHLVHFVKATKDSVKWPVSALRLLSSFMETASRIEDSGLMRLSLRDLPQFEKTLEHLVQDSSEFDITLRKINGQLYLVDANLSPGDNPTFKKRKRSDEDDSGEDDVIESNPPALSTTNVLEHDSTQIFTRLLEKSSGKARLIARAVSVEGIPLKRG